MLLSIFFIISCNLETEKLGGKVQKIQNLLYFTRTFSVSSLRRQPSKVTDISSVFCETNVNMRFNEDAIILLLYAHSR